MPETGQKRGHLGRKRGHLTPAWKSWPWMKHSEVGTADTAEARGTDQRSSNNFRCPDRGLRIECVDSLGFLESFCECLCLAFAGYNSLIW